MLTYALIAKKDIKFLSKVFLKFLRSLKLTSVFDTTISRNLLTTGVRLSITVPIKDLISLYTVKLNPNVLSELRNSLRTSNGIELASNSLSVISKPKSTALS